MATCANCLHHSLCDYNTNISGNGKVRLVYSEGADVKCSFFENTADVVPKSEVENLKLEYAGFEAGARQIIEALKSVIPPCKIGDTVYAVRTYYGTRKVMSGKISEMFFVGKEMTLCIVVKGISRGQWMKDVFPSYEEAERSMRSCPRTK